MKFAQNVQNMTAALGIALSSAGFAAPQEEPQRQPQSPSSARRVEADWAKDLKALPAVSKPSATVGSNSPSLKFLALLTQKGADVNALIESLPKEALEDRTLHRSIRLAIVGSDTPVSTEAATKLLRSNSFVESTLGARPSDLWYETGPMWSTLLRRAEPEAAQRVANRVGTAFEKALRSEETAQSMLRRLIPMIPPCVRQCAGLRNAYADCLKKHPLDIVLVLNSKDFGVPQAKVLEGVLSALDGKTEMPPSQFGQMVVSAMTREALESKKELRPLILATLTDHAAAWSTLSDDVCRSSAFASLILSEVQLTPAFFTLIPPDLYRQGSPLLNDELRKGLDQIVDRQEKQFAEESAAGRFSKVPFLALERRSVRQAIRNNCNRAFAKGRMAATLAAQIPQFGDFAIAIPEMIRACCPPGQPLPLSEEELTWVAAASPGAFGSLLERAGSALPPAALQQYRQTVEALRLLGITSVTWFDDCFNVIQGRYPFAPPATRQRLVKLMPPGYFNIHETDERPFAIIVAGQPGTDHNGAFWAHNNDGETLDFIDRFADGYRTLLYQPQNIDEMVMQLTELRVQFGVRAELLMLMGHGQPGQIRIGNSPFTGSISSTDLRLVDLQGLLKPNASIVLGSCFSADRSASMASMQDRFVELFPDCYVSAGSGAVSGPDITISKDGRIADVRYGYGATVTYDPVTKKVTRRELEKPKKASASKNGNVQNGAIDKTGVDNLGNGQSGQPRRSLIDTARNVFAPYSRTVELLLAACGITFLANRLDKLRSRLSGSRR